MACLLPLALVALVFASSSFSTAELEDEYAKAAAVTGDCMLGVNLVRTGRLDHGITKVVRDEQLEKSAMEYISKTVVRKDCKVKTLQSHIKEPATIFQTQSKNVPTRREILNLFDTTVNENLDTLREFNFQPGNSLVVEDSKTIYSFMLLVLPILTKVGCAAAADCAAGKNTILCIFSHDRRPTKADFTLQRDVYESLLERKNAGIKLEELSEVDLDTPLNRKNRNAKPEKVKQNSKTEESTKPEESTISEENAEPEESTISEENAEPEDSDELESVNKNANPDRSGAGNSIPGAAVIFLTLLGLLNTL